MRRPKEKLKKTIVYQLIILNAKGLINFSNGLKMEALNLISLNFAITQQTTEEFMQLET